ncbi:hypothetical protein [Streptacidiphilus albus]|uniref:hypothetical protein n=1 Tax=Streptacidiphilus albus TaxID=105425 RepID=UPI00054BAC50|nr:hypothetical protein [Streptacidiphilus albus]
MRISDLATPQLTEFWSLREDVRVSCESDPVETLVLHASGTELRIAHPSALLREAVRRMLLGSVSLRNIVPDFPDYNTPHDSLDVGTKELLVELAELGHLIIRTIAVGSETLLSVITLESGNSLTPEALPATWSAHLAPSVRIRLLKHRALIESSSSCHRAEIEQVETLDRLGLTQRPHPEALPAEPAAPLPASALDASIAYLVAADLVLLAE